MWQKKASGSEPGFNAEENGSARQYGAIALSADFSRTVPPICGKRIFGKSHMLWGADPPRILSQTTTTISCRLAKSVHQMIPSYRNHRAWGLRAFSPGVGLLSPVYNVYWSDSLVCRLEMPWSHRLRPTILSGPFPLVHSGLRGGHDEPLDRTTAAPCLAPVALSTLPCGCRIRLG